MPDQRQKPNTPEEIMFDANMREFAVRVRIICELETGGHITAQEAYQRVKRLFKQLKKSKKSLEIGTEVPADLGDDAT